MGEKERVTSSPLSSQKQQAITNLHLRTLFKGTLCILLEAFSIKQHFMLDVAAASLVIFHFIYSF